MALKEHENNIITKEENDPITLYLKNIIQRYFQIENEISQESKEAIIIQAYTRLKEILNAYSNKYIICINERSGNIDLFIRDFGGEETFDKNTAFNKDFCDVTTESATLWNDDVEDYFNYGEKQEDHLVVGDDDRLSNARIPLAHIHTIDEVKGLREKLEEYNLINGGFHLHTNQNILNMLIYTGSRVSIDLILIEDLVARVEKAVERFKETDEYFTSIGQRYINQLQDIFTPIYNKLQYVDDNIDLWISDFVKDANTYTDVKNFSFKQYIHTLLKNYLSNEEFNLLKDTLEHSIRVVDSGTIPVTGANFILNNLDSINTKTEHGQYHDSEFDIKYGYTKLALSCMCNKQITGNVLQNFANNNIINGDLEVFFEYNQDGKHYRDMLPHVYSLNDSQHDFIYADYEIDESNNINVYFKRLSCLPVYLYHPKNKSNEFNDRLYFCDNTYMGFYNDLKTYLSDFNADLCNVTNTNKDYLASISLLQDSELPYYHVNNGSTQYFINGDVESLTEDEEWYYYGEFLYGSLNSLFDNATISYRLFTVPGKGEDNA